MIEDICDVSIANVTCSIWYRVRDQLFQARRRAYPMSVAEVPADDKRRTCLQVRHRTAPCNVNVNVSQDF